MGRRTLEAGWCSRRLLRGFQLETNSCGDRDLFSRRFWKTRMRVDPENDDISGALVRGQQPAARRVYDKIPGHLSQRRLKSFDGEFTARAIDGENGEVVGVAAVGGIEISSIRSHMDIRAADVTLITRRMRREVLY